MFNKTRVGNSISEIETPALLLDLVKLEVNIAQMASYFYSLEASLRPHIKTHKLPIIAHKQIMAGAKGITCAKLSEAEVMAASGIRDILIANQIVSIPKIKRLIGLTRHCDITIAVDNLSNTQDLSEIAKKQQTNLNVIIEIDVGMARSGIRNFQEITDLVKKIVDLPNLVFKGIMGYEGHAVHIEIFDQRKEVTLRANTRLLESKEQIEKLGIPVQIVSAGGTGTYNISGSYPGITEIQAGSYATMDANYQKLEGIHFEQALTVLATVISRPEKNRVILDVGMKGITGEFGIPYLKETPEAQIIKLSEEHAVIDLKEVSKNRTCQNFSVGSKVELIPTHGCTTINLHQEYFAIRNGLVEAVWPILARGAII